MRKQMKVGILLLIMTAGCASLRTPETNTTDVKPTPNPNRIEISNSYGSGLYGGEATTAKWVLEKTGPCRGTITSGRNAGNSGTTVTEYEVPPETFDQCRRLLESTQFLQMRVKRPDFLFEASCWGISATFNGRTNTVGVYSQGPPGVPDGFVKLRDFLDELPKRGKVISKVGPAP